jgi:hypothetical protein
VKHLIAVAGDCQKGYFSSLVTQAHDAGIDLLWMELKPFSWRKLIMWERDVARQYPSNLIAFADAWDMLFLGTKGEFEDVIGAQPLLFHSEKVCWPDSRKAQFYPDTDSPWRYVNGTGPAGLGDAISAAIDYGMSHFPITNEYGGVSDATQDNDQRFWTDVYLSGVGKLDTDCRLSQSLVDLATGDLAVKDRRIVNKITGAKPLFLHANGAAAMQGYRHLMDMMSPSAAYPCLSITHALAGKPKENP